MVECRITPGSEQMTCTLPCMATQFTIATDIPGGSLGQQMGLTMVPLVPHEQYSNSFWFTTPYMEHSSDVIHALLAVVVDRYPVTELFINDDDLSLLEWSPGPYDEFATAMITLEKNEVYHLYTTDSSQTFAGYVYTIRDDYYYPTKGYAIGYGGNGQNRTDDRDVPLYEITVLGQFISGNGEDFTPECNNQYSNNLSTKAASLVSVINDNIGTTLCTRHETGDMELLRTVNVIFYAEEQEGNTKVTYKMESKNYLMLADVYECAAEINVYLQDFSNWGEPILPPLEDCPPVVFQPAYFIDGSTGYDWVCTGTSKLDVQADENHPAYSFVISDSYTTYEEEALAGECIAVYGDSWSDMVWNMVLTLQEELDQGDLCRRLEGLLSLSYISQFIAESSTTGTIQATFFISPETDQIRFTDIMQCSDEIFTRVEPHSEWSTGPLIPPASGCPLLTFPDSDMFDKNDETWICPAQVTSVV